MDSEMFKSMKVLAVATGIIMLPLVTTEGALSQPLLAQLMPPSVYMPQQVPHIPATAVPAPAGRAASDTREIEARILVTLAIAAERDGKLVQAIDLYQQVMDLGKQTGKPSVDVAVAEGRVGGIYADLHQFRLAIHYANMSLAEFQKILGPVSDDVAIELNNVGWMKEQLGLNKQAEAAYKQALSVLYASSDADDDLIGISENNYAHFLASGHRDREAYQHYQKAYAHMKQCFGPNYPLSKYIQGQLRQAKKQLDLPAAKVPARSQDSVKHPGSR